MHFPPPALVFLPGTAGSASEFKPQVDFFSSSYPCKVIEPTSGSFEEWILETKTLLEAETSSHQTMILIGHSLGGLLALHLAEQASPHYKVLGIVLIDTLLLVPEAVRASLLELRSALHSESSHEVLSHFVRTYLVSEKENEDQREALITKILTYPREKFLKLWAVSEDFDAEKILSTLSVPLLYLHAGVPTDLERLKQINPGKIEVIETGFTGHYPHLFAPRETNAHLELFFKKNQTRT